MSNEKRRHNALPDGYKLHWYEIHAILGRGGFGITYLALDTNLNHEVAIKEFLPTDLAMRASDASIHPISDDHTDTFGWGLNRFINEAQTLAQFRHPNIVLVHSVFEANGTAYMVMEYEKGESLEQAYNLHRLGTEEELLGILFPLMDGLQRIHESGFVHRDIKPKNIYLRDDGRPVLLDFGSARQALGVETRTLTTLVSPGYAPFEQYNATRESDKQGPWTDIYALGATIYRGMAGKSPVDALARANAKLEGHDDILEPAVEVGKDKFSRPFLEAIDRALAFAPEERPQSIAAWRELLPECEDAVTSAAPSLTAARAPQRAPVDRDAPTELTPDTAQENAFTDEGTLIVGGGTPRAGTPAARAAARKSPVVIAVAVIAVIGIAIGIWRMQVGEQADSKPEVAATGSGTTPAAGTGTATGSSAGSEPAPVAAALPSAAEVTALLGTIDCSLMRADVRDGALVVDGYVAGAKPMERTSQILGRIGGVTNDVRELPSIFCKTIELYGPYVKKNREEGLGARIDTPRQDDVFFNGENLIVDVTAPNYLSWLYVDYYGHEGSVVHLLPAVEDDENNVEPRVQLQLGADGGMKVWQIAPPYGTEMIVLLASSKPVFEVKTPEEWAAWENGDQAGEFRERLRKRLQTLESASDGAKIAAELLVVTTREKP